MPVDVAAKRDTRAIEAELFERMESGDVSARWELWQRQEPMVRSSARKFASGDNILEEELITEAFSEFEKAMRSYNFSLERKRTFSDWYFRYLGQRFASMKRARATLQSGGWTDFADLPKAPTIKEIVRSAGFASVEDIPVQAMNGRVNVGGESKHFYHAGDPPINADTLPRFLNPETQRVAEMLVAGFQPGEIKAALGLTESQYRKKLKVVRMKLEAVGA